MQYAQIVPNIKTDFKQTLFTYKIPASLLPEVKIGSLVKIPFGNRKILGLVFDIKRKRSFKIQNLKLKSIVKIVVSDFEFPTQLKKLSLWISNYYHVPLSQVIFALLPKPVQNPDRELNPKKYGVIVKTADGRSGLLLPDLDGVDSANQQIAIASQKAGIIEGEPVFLYKFTVKRHEE